MAKKKPEKKRGNVELVVLEKLSSSDIPEAKEKEFLKPNPRPIDQIFEQRHSQRVVLFRFAIFTTSILLFILISSFLLQLYFRIVYDVNDLFDPVYLNIFTVSVFGEVIGVIYIIAKSLWNDEAYKDYFKK